jgi:RND family efflux transporter MFP subunit
MSFTPVMNKLKAGPKSIGRFIKRHWKLLLFVLVLLAGGWWWWSQRSKQNTPQLTFVKPTTQNLAKTVEVSGVLDAHEKASLRFAAGGKVVYLGAQEGDTVKKGQTLATIDQRELQKRLQQDLNSYMRERWDWDQTLDDTKDRTLPPSEVRDKQKEQWNLDDTVLDVEIRDISIQNTRLTSPINGILVSMPTVVTGINLLATDVFEVVNPQTLVFKAAVDETDIGLIKLGQTAQINFDAYPDEPLTAYIEDISYKSTQSSSGTVFVVRIPITGDGLLSRYKLGMNGDVTITVDTRENVLTVPLDATKDRDGKTFVAVKITPDPTKPEMVTTEDREIQTDLETDDWVEVTGGLSPDDEVLMP